MALILIKTKEACLNQINFGVPLMRRDFFIAD